MFFNENAASAHMYGEFLRIVEPQELDVFRRLFQVSESVG